MGVQIFFELAKTPTNNNLDGLFDSGSGTMTSNPFDHP